MEPRLDYAKAAPGVLRAMLALQEHVGQSGLDAGLRYLICLRVSQINGCAFCVAMHAEEMRAAGEPEARIDLVAVWRESPGFTPRERAALAWAEAVNGIAAGGVPDDVYAEARRHFSEAELAELTLAVVAINGWNRLNVAFRVPPGARHAASAAHAGRTAA